MNFRSSKVDKRFLNRQDRQDFAGSSARQEREEQRVRARRGAIAYERNRPERTTEQTPGTGGISPGLEAQAQRNREIGQMKRRGEELRPPIPSITMYGPEDPAV